MPPIDFASFLKKTRASSSSKKSNLDREQYLYLTTRGRRSGLPREIEIWFVSLAGRYYVIAEYPTSNWVRNIRAHPEVRVRVANEEFSGKARVLAERSEALQRKIQALSREKYGWGEGLVVEIVPDRAN